MLDQQKMRNTLALVVVSQFISVVISCGPGGGSRRSRWRDHKVKDDRIPNVNEQSGSASGPFQGALHPTDPKLIQILATDIVFKDKTYNANARKAIKPCHDSLIKLASVVKSFWEDKYKLYVIEGYLPNQKNGHYNHGSSSLHFSGRAFDISLTNSPGNKNKNSFTRLGDVVPKHTLKSLAGLAYYNAKFTFVQIKEDHLHVSCDTTTHQSSSSRCFSANSFVRNNSGKKVLMKNVKIGDKVLTRHSDGHPVYSEVIMMMHRNPHILVDDFVRISTNANKSITLSEYHLLPTTKNLEFVFSKDVRVNQTVQTYNAESKAFENVHVKSIDRVSSQGVYAPLTKDGTIVVDDVYASCYALFPSHDVSHWVFSIWRAIYPYFSRSSPLVDNTNEYHWYADVFRRSMNSLNIFSYPL